MAGCSQYDQVLRPFTLQQLTLQQRYDAATIMIQQMKGKNLAADPNYVWGAWEFWGKSVVESKGLSERHKLYKIIQWCHQHKDMLIIHKAWWDRNTVVNVYRDGEYTPMNSWAMIQWLEYSEEERFMLEREFEYYQRVRLVRKEKERMIKKIFDKC